MTLADGAFFSRQVRAHSALNQHMNPYTSLSSKAFWRTGVADTAPDVFADLWTPKFSITPTTPILTVGSCFAQHLGRALRDAGYRWEIPETAPYGLPESAAATFHYGYFSFRIGNVYTPVVLETWLNWAAGQKTMDREIWEVDGAFYDPLRPQVEPGGFETADELFAARDETLAAMRRGIADSDIFVLTLGLTEAWQNSATGLTYATCPGTIAGSFDPELHVFRNFSFEKIRAQVRGIRTLLQSLNPDIKMILTVSPVPLTATAASDQHVLTATGYSKSVLRAVAGELCANHADVDYFPSYEIVALHPLKGALFESNLRSVRPAGVVHVMKHFFAALDGDRSAVPDQSSPDMQAAVEQELEALDIVCEDEQLEKLQESPNEPNT